MWHSYGYHASLQVIFEWKVHIWFTEINSFYGVDYCFAIFGMCNGYVTVSYPSRLLSLHIKLNDWCVVESSIAHIEWIQRNVFDTRGSSTGSEGIEKHLKKQKGEGVQTENICSVEGLQWQHGSRGDLKELEMYKLTRQLETSCVS